MRDPFLDHATVRTGYAIHARVSSLSFGCLRRFSVTLSSSTPEPESTPRGKLAKHLRLIRQAAGFATQAPLANRLGVSSDLISKMETGKHVPTQDIFLALLDICGVSEEARGYLTDLWVLARAGSGGVLREFFEKYATAEGKAAFLRMWGPAAGSRPVADARVRPCDVPQGRLGRRRGSRAD
jgi:transcriptional regulator with XRE-family HTH domain